MLCRLLLGGLLSLTLHVQAQPTAGISFQPAQLNFLANDIPVDVAIIRGYGTERNWLIAVQGSNLMYRYVQIRHHGIYWTRSDTLTSPPLSVLAFSMRPPGVSGGDQDYVVLTADGNLRPWAVPVSNVGPFQRPPVPLRGGRPCAPTDRLIAGNYQPGMAIDVACWSNGQDPGIWFAENLTNGSFQTRSRLNPMRDDNALAMTSGRIIADTVQWLEDLVVPRDWNYGSGFGLWVNHRLNSPLLTWSSALARYYAASSTGRTTCAATGDVDGDGVVDIVTGGSVLSVFHNARIGYVNQFRPDMQEYATLTAAREVRLADINGDNRPEMLMLGNDNTLSVFENTSRTDSLYFNPIPYVYPVGNDPATIRVVDGDNDGDLDVLIPSRGDHLLNIFWNNQRVLATEPAAPALQLDTYPNPAQNAVHLRWTSQLPGLQAVTLLDATGRVVRQWPAVASDTALDVADLPRGMYLLRAATGAKAVSKRLLLN